MLECGALDCESILYASKTNSFDDTLNEFVLTPLLTSLTHFHAICKGEGRRDCN